MGEYLLRPAIERQPLPRHYRTAAAKALAASRTDNGLAVARGIAFALVKAYWETAHSGRNASQLCCPPLPTQLHLEPVPSQITSQMQDMKAHLTGMEVIEASHFIGTLYTQWMPRRTRSALGAFYTPPAIGQRLLDMATEAGVDWSSARVLDPACGGGVFLVAAAQRMASAAPPRGHWDLKDIARRVRGCELDPFAAWMARTFLMLALSRLDGASRTSDISSVKVCNSLEYEFEENNFDLVIGNPPYGRITLAPELRQKFRRSLFGHANLYGVFTDLALRLSRPGGIIAFVTPTSFLAGEYFKALRSLLALEAPPVSLDFIAARKGVFADALQEILLATYRRGGSPSRGKVHFIAPAKDGQITLAAIGSFRLPPVLHRPWLVPRTQAQNVLIRLAETAPHRLADYGYKVSTGPLVWNRHKASLRDTLGQGRFPVIWAEAVRSDGGFEFRAQRRNHYPYFEPLPHERWVVTKAPCILLQRTTAKEQSRRLVAAELPAAFIERHNGVVIENHLNMIRPIHATPAVSLAALAALLNTHVLDQLFRCLNGSVAVSAYELEALPLPAPEAMQSMERLIRRKADHATIERTAAYLVGYGPE